ncbi:toxin-antitoxin system TumE family protein [Noviherbaspirillum soli]|uniref:toxin-antitoxin system TumE family protein n=1 Tax=Noviherbaspirillum soli TaxID=1064518 RepID=UPI00188C47B5|nr:DUF6516 family protein [Noviherbaspirillum soli]
MNSKNTRDTGLDYLLGLNDTIEVQNDQGYWVKFDVQLVEVTEDRPHGIKYSLTLHAPSGARLIGFDNAHAVPPPGSSFKNAGKKFPFDHQHRHAKDVGVLYQFNTPFQLVSDFYTEVDRVLKDLCK